MIQLPRKLKETLEQLDQRKSDFLQGWLTSVGDLEGEWSLAPDYSALVKKKEADDATTDSRAS